MLCKESQLKHHSLDWNFLLHYKRTSGFHPNEDKSYFCYLGVRVTRKGHLCWVKETSVGSTRETQRGMLNPVYPWTSFVGTLRPVTKTILIISENRGRVLRVRKTVGSHFIIVRVNNQTFILFWNWERLKDSQKFIKNTFGVLSRILQINITKFVNHLYLSYLRTRK